MRDDIPGRRTSGNKIMVMGEGRVYPDTMCYLDWWLEHAERLHGKFGLEN